MTRTTGSRAGAPRPSMADVARLAGVSSQTVSRVSNGQSNVDERTRARVVKAMQTLGYRPNGAARALKSGRFHTIGVIMTTLATLGNMRTLDAIATEAARADYSVMLMPIADPTLRGVSGAYQRLSAQAVDGAVIILEARLLDQAEFALPPGIPVVVIDSGAGPGYAVVDTDQALGARQATGHLLSLGHRQVWHIAGPETSFSAVHREQSWRRTLEEAGIAPPPVLRGDWTCESGYQHGLVLGRRADVTAIFAANDQMGLGAMQALHELGRDIPGDISIVGFDDMDVARSFWPPLTTIRQDFAAVGRLSIRKLLRKVSDASTGNDTTIVPTELIIRSSTAAPGERRHPSLWIENQIIQNGRWLLRGTLPLSRNLAGRDESALGGAKISVSVPGRDVSLYGLAATRDLLASLPAAVAYLSGPDLIVDFANEACFRLVGDRELLGRPVGQALPELVAQGEVEILARIMETGEAGSGSKAGVLIRRHGRAERRFVDYVFQPVRAPGGGVAGILLYAADVTAHVRDQRGLAKVAGQLTDAEERYRTLFETMPPGIIHCATDGTVLGTNPAARQLLGMGESEMTGWPLATIRRAVHADGTQFQPEELPVSRALSTGQTAADVLMGVPHGQTGELRWLLATAVPDARDGQGRPQRAYVMFTDVTEQRRLETALRESTSLLGRLRETNVLGVVSSTGQGAYEANDAFLDIIGYTRDDLAAGRISYQSITAPEWAGRDRRALGQLRRAGAFQPYDKEYVHRDGHRVPVLVGGAVIDRNPLRWVTFVVDLTARQRAERESAELLARERAALAEAQSSGERLALLMRAGALVAAARDRDELLDQVTQLVVPSLADYCVVFLPTADGKLCAGALTHADPARARKLAALRELPVPAAGPLISQRAYTTGTTQLVRDVVSELPSWAAVDAEMAEIVASMRPHSALATPLLAGLRTLGVLVLGRGGGRPRFAGADAEVVEEIARRLSVGLANADTFASEHAIAETLQRSILPDTLPRIPGLDLAVRYLPATQGADIGGDWYDAFPVPGGRIALVTGDVAGHSIGSASIMGQVRSMLRAYAVDNPHPGRVLRQTNTALARLLPEALASVVYAVLDLGTGGLTYANAGHPPPIVITAAGQAVPLDDTTGTMLGACGSTTFATGYRRLSPGAGLLCYTDGLIEDRHRDITEGLSLLTGALGLSAPSSAEHMCATVEAALLGTGHRADDVCLLAAHLTG